MKKALKKAFPLLTLAFILAGSLHAKILIFTYSYNRPEFIEMQHKTFQKFLLDDYEFVVFCDAHTDEMAQEIESVCQRLGLRYVRIPQEIHEQPYLERFPGEPHNQASIRNSHVVQYSYDQVGQYHDDILVLIDSDIFLTRPFSAREFLEGYDIAGVMHVRTYGAEQFRYPWIGLVFLRMNTLPEKETICFNCRLSHKPIDAGGYVHYYLQRHPELRIRAFNQLRLNCNPPRTIKCEKCLPLAGLHPRCTHPLQIVCPQCRSKIKQNQQETFACTHNTEILRELGLSNATIRRVQAGAHSIESVMNDTFFHYRGGSGWAKRQSEGNFHKHKGEHLRLLIQEVLEETST